ncbi:hypothetical protein BDV93DRAFT_565796 [Ceratobasidium sp. AG-I]|nr:hypothetical protein BDV93DRAFT_565796 [Ceratobasidium sp. AG-I]
MPNPYHTAYQAYTLKSAQAVMESVDFSKFFTVYTSEMRQGEGLFFASPSILERKFRDGVELYKVKPENSDKDEWCITSSAANALVDALLQVRDVVGNHCGTLAESTGHPAEYTVDDPLYRRFREIGLLYPLEPAGIFEIKTWEKGFPTLPDLVQKVVCAQIWAMWMIAVLHCLAKADDLDHMDILPPFPCAHFARAWKGYEK